MCDRYYNQTISFRSMIIKLWCYSSAERAPHCLPHHYTPCFAISTRKYMGSTARSEGKYLPGAYIVCVDECLHAYQHTPYFAISTRTYMGCTMRFDGRYWLDTYITCASESCEWWHAYSYPLNYYQSCLSSSKITMKSSQGLSCTVN